MKIKNITFLQAHYEKLLLGFGVIILAFAGFYYGMETPNLAKIENRLAKPGEIDPAILKEAQGLKRALDSTEIDPKLANMQIPTYGKDFAERLVTPVTTVAALQPPKPAFGAANPNDPGKSGFYYEPATPAPKIVSLATDMAAVSPQEVAANLELKQMLPKDGPADIAWVSMVGIFDVAAMLQELTKSPPGIKRLESPWWQNSFSVADVQMERQEETGPDQWSESKLIPVLPGAAFDPRQIKKTLNQNEAAAYVGHIRKYQMTIIQPPFPQLRGKQWNPPAGGLDDADAAGAGASELLKAKSNMDNIKRQLDQAKAFLERLNNAAKSAPAPKSTTSAAKTSTSKTALADEEAEGIEGASAGDKTSAISNQSKKVIDLEKRFADAQEVYRKLLPAAAPGKAAAPDAPATPGTDAAEAAIQQGILGRRSVDLWASDLTVEPGKTYRYRMRVRIINPLFRRSEPPEEQRKKHFDQFLVEGAWSDWTKPVAVPRKFYYFFTGAGVGPTQATVEVWKFFDGKWRSAEFRLKPGDAVGETRVADRIDVEFSTGASVVDVFKNVVKAANNVPVSTYRVMLMDGDQVDLRVIEEDKNDPMLLKLRADALTNKGGQ